MRHFVFYPTDPRDLHFIVRAETLDEARAALDITLAELDDIASLPRDYSAAPVAYDTHEGAYIDARASGSGDRLFLEAASIL